MTAHSSPHDAMFPGRRHRLGDLLEVDLMAVLIDVAEEPYRPFVIIARVPGADDVAGLDGCLFRAAAFVFLDPGRPRLPEVRGLQIAGIALI